MYQLAKDLAKEFDGDVGTLKHRNQIKYLDLPTREDIIIEGKELNIQKYKQIITLLFPMHWLGREYKRRGLHWICYDQKTPPAEKQYFPNLLRRQYMKVFNRLNAWSIKGADEYWDVTEREQKPRWTKKRKETELDLTDYATYIGRRTDYKNFAWLQKTMKDLNIPFKPSRPNSTDDEIWYCLSNAKMLVTASLWEGYGRPVMEAEALGIPAVAYDVGSHKRHIKKGICIPLDIKNIKKSEELFKKAILEVWQRETNKKPG